MPEAAAKRKFGKGRGSLFLPGCGVEKIGNWCCLICLHRDRSTAKGRYRPVLPHGYFIVAKSVQIPQSAQILPCLKILNGICARSGEIVMGNRVLHAPQICVDPILCFVERTE
jgi:hypothetical protein